MLYPLLAAVALVTSPELRFGQVELPTGVRIHYAEQGHATGPVLILLHGYGSNEHDLISMAPYLDRRFLILSARAPYNYGWNGYAWFEIGFTGNGDSSTFVPWRN